MHRPFPCGAVYLLYYYFPFLLFHIFKTFAVIFLPIIHTKRQPLSCLSRRKIFSRLSFNFWGRETSIKACPDTIH
nr:MAG TPA: hypothetical protein [Caudoviricetes sp.]